ncbi:cobyrinate a,c-diamide synthase [Desulfovibrio litoralis]|uniref:Cobyrinic acid a,c-diamide synthase n=1 Tax=Desulfovibrio litoralis DSM 11393 TaxID=1121455 RepID=A0A1M7S5X1_9BACT|nr:cobyrinate a,c-diamide synthase [Desulfovibrio litoralis]SHN53830.1 cobyrinic acid a,c-diamide synthase [Desulfovibrio litoralis DSM 11393]
MNVSQKACGSNSDFFSGFMIAGTSTNSGKTSLVLAFMTALKRRNFQLFGFKSGPDYIDPLLHYFASANLSYNLDTCLMSEDSCRQVFYSERTQTKIADNLFSGLIPFQRKPENQTQKLGSVHIVEAAMGLFDGVYGGAKSSSSPRGSAGFLAKILNIPIVLVVDAASYAHSIAAMVQGFVNFDPELNFLGVIVNKVASLKHKELIREAFEVYCPHIPLLALIPKESKLELKSRYLGLNFEAVAEESYFDLLADRLEAHLEINLIDFVQSLPRFKYTQNLDEKDDRAKTSLSCLGSKPVEKIHKDKVRIGIAADKAFCFHYALNYQALMKAGAELEFFSPLNDKNIPHNLDALLLGGGYTEEHAKDLSCNINMLHSINEALNNGVSVWAEGGGFIYLGKGLYIQGKDFFSFADYFPLSFSFEQKRQGLGYVNAEFKNSTLVAQKNSCLSGHLFHYSKVLETEFPLGFIPLYALTNYNGTQVEEKKIVACVKSGTYNAGGFMHLMCNEKDNIAENFVQLCKKTDVF